MSERNTRDKKRTPAKFYGEDLVRLTDDPNTHGIVIRCWHDAEDLQPPHADEPDVLARPLTFGEVGISYYPGNVREILPESALTLVDRMYQPGDLLKRSVDDVRAGVVTSIDVKGRLEHAISGERIPGWYNAGDTECAIDIDMGDYVVYDDWVGQVIEMFDEAVIQLGDGPLLRVPEISARLTVGERGPDLLPAPLSTAQSIFGFILGGRQNIIDTVVAVQRTVLAVAWLAINQSLAPEEAQARSRPQRFWHGQDLGKLTLVRRRAEQALRVGDVVVLKNSEGVPVTRHGQETDPQGMLEVRTCVVKETQTTVNVLWQDGSREILQAKDTIPYLNPDEYDCWPGDHVLWKSEDQKRPAIVQSVDAVNRTAQVRFTDTEAEELVSVLELDPHGQGDWSTVDLGSDGLGVARGDFVFIHREGSTNGLEKPQVPKIGELEEWVREAPIVHPDGKMGGWRREMTNLGGTIAETRGKDPTVEEGKIKRPRKDDPSLNWFGEVTDLRLDGAVEVMLPDSTLVSLPMERLTRLYDGLEQLEEIWGDEMWGDGVSENPNSLASGDDDVEVWNDDGQWVENIEADGDDWSTDEEDNTMDIDEDGWNSSSPTVLPLQDPASPSESGVSTPHVMDNVVHKDSQVITGLRHLSPDVPKDAVETEEVEEAIDDMEDESKSPWKRFDVLPSAPPDHAFYASPSAQTSRNFLGRLHKEYKVLASSLPESILVRAYEDRTDLLRSLIIGPENTPYENAPFVIDWKLDSNFPHSPPIAHFLSWTNGNGRVNPNLYEEGKVCLSILGTWAGDKNEIWSASRSSLLQALVSIQGLVLVKEPWFCEPAYEKLRGTEDGIVNSRLYSEKAYVLSRGFVRRALEIPLGSLENEINWLYYGQGRLEKVLHDAQALIAKSKESAEECEADQELAVPRLSGGGIITLERTLVKLQALLYSHQ